MDYSLFLKIPVFKGLSENETEALLSSTPKRIKKIRAGVVIALRGEIVRSLMIVTSGLVKGEMVDYAGRTIKIEDIPAPGTLAPAFIFGARNRFPVNVIAVTDTELFVIDKQDFLKLLESNEKILINFLDLISNRSQFLSEKIKFLRFKTIKGKLAQYILQQAGEEVSYVRMDMTRNDLAEFFGVARPSISRVLRELEDENYLEVRGKDIRIIDKKKLALLTID
jgi:CRP-like cAMP-binding protein